MRHTDEAEDATGCAHCEGVCQQEAECCARSAPQNVSGQERKGPEHSLCFRSDGQQCIAAQAEVHKAVVQKIGCDDPAHMSYCQVLTQCLNNRQAKVTDCT